MLFSHQLADLIPAPNPDCNSRLCLMDDCCALCTTCPACCTTNTLEICWAFEIPFSGCRVRRPLLSVSTARAGSSQQAAAVRLFPVRTKKCYSPFAATGFWWFAYAWLLHRQCLDSTCILIPTNCSVMPPTSPIFCYVFSRQEWMDSFQGRRRMTSGWQTSSSQQKRRIQIRPWRVSFKLVSVQLFCSPDGLVTNQPPLMLLPICCC